MAIQGFVAAGYESVGKEFERNFSERGELGAAFAAVRDGRLVVDLWGGFLNAERSAAWQQDTLQLVFSGAKGLVALCMLMLVDRGDLDIDAPVARYWPQFAAQGKSAIRLSDVASHQALLPGVHVRLSEQDLLDPVALAELLAAQPLDPDPRAAYVYHPLTYGWLCGEIIRRVDGRSIGRFFAEEVAGPLGLEIWMGLPGGLEPRVSTLCYANQWGARGFTDEQIAADTLMASVWANPLLFPRDRIPWNTCEFHAAEIPGANAIGTARSLARLYGCLSCGGELDGIRLLSSDTLNRGRLCLARRRDGLTNEPAAYGFGFELQTELRAFGPPEQAFGYRGAGGSVHGAWPQECVGLSYCMNEMRDDQVDPRAAALLEALHRAAQSVKSSPAARSVATR